MTRRAVLLSSLGHALVAAALLIHVVPVPPPPAMATVELIQQPTPSVGDGPATSGTAGPAAQAAAPPPAPPPIPPSSADLPPQPAEPPAPPQTASPAVPMPSQAAELPPPSPAPPPPMSPVLPTRPQKAVQPAPAKEARVAPRTPPPQPQTDHPEGDPGGAPAIRLGEGGDVGTGLVENVIPAELDSKVHNKPPGYPDEAARLGEEGTVVLLVHVAPDGSAAAVEVRTTSGYERLDRAARDAVTHWHFRPAIRDGGPVASDMPVQVRFVLKG